MRLGPEVMGSEGKSLTMASIPPYVPSPMGLQSGSKLCPLQKERSSSDKICSLREEPDGDGVTMHIDVSFSMQGITQCREQLGSYSAAVASKNPQNLGMNLRVLALTSPSTGGI